MYFGSAAVFLLFAAAPMTVGAGAGAADVAAGAAAVAAGFAAAVAAGALVDAAALVGAADGEGLLHAAMRSPTLVPAPSWMKTRLLTMPSPFCRAPR